MIHTAKLSLLTCLSFLPGILGQKAETRRLRRIKHFRGQRSLQQFELKLANLDTESVVIDLGANQGVYTELLAGTGAQVYAFEPEPWCFSQLEKRVGTLNNVTLINAAAMLDDGVVKMRRNPDFENNPGDESLGTSVVEWTPTLDTGSFFEAKCIDFIRFVRELGKPVDLLKMDIEGGEVPLLETLLDCSEIELIRSAFIETHEVNMPELRKRLRDIRERIQARHNLDFDLDWP